MEANMEEEKKGTESKYAGLSKGQIKKLKDKEKKDKAAAAGATAGEGGVEVGLEDAAAEEAPAKGTKAAKKGKKGKGGLSEAAKARLLET
jgi:translation initiation factor 5B